MTVNEMAEHLDPDNFVDVTFPPCNDSAFNESDREPFPFDHAIHWRRARDFLVTDMSRLDEGKGELEVFYDRIEPNDIN
jgi:hypothetical protein